MGKEAELFKAAQSGNIALLERVFASYLKKQSSGGFGSVRAKTHPNIQDEAGYTLLHHATLQGQGETVALLLRCGASTTISDNTGSCPLHLAAWKGDLDIVKLLVTQGPSRANVNQQNDSEDAALHLASQYGFSDVVEYLLQRHADPMLLNSKSESALDLAAQYGHINSVHLLISHCPEMLYIQRTAFSPLHLAARNGHTVVTLSLINAGISVNTVCESGSALHEAAMFGKVDTVELLLDKGVNLELKDSKGRTALDLLADYTAEQAVRIRALIAGHQSSCEPRAGAGGIVAVAGTNSLPVVESSSALAFKRGDTIAVLEARGGGLYSGTCHGKTGTFLAEDVTFYTELDGELVPADASSLPTPNSHAQEVGVMKVAVSRQDPYEHLPGFPVTPTETSASPTQTESVNQSDSRTLSPVTVSDIAVEANKNNLSEEMKLPRQEGTEEAVTATEESATASAVGDRGERKRLSRKEKLFQLSRDTGAYAELNPINPMEAQKQFGESLKLNPVGPAFGVQSEAAVLTSHNSPAKQQAGEQQFQGSYYVLEVGNFEQGSEARVTISPPTEAPPPADGYYMLDIKHFDSNRSSYYENVSKPVTSPDPRGPSPSKPPSYENIQLEEVPPPLPKKTRQRVSTDRPSVAEKERQEVSADKPNEAGNERQEVSADKPSEAGNERQEVSVDKPSEAGNERRDVKEGGSRRRDMVYEQVDIGAKISSTSEPFAGLVLSCSTEGEQESRQRTETLWDNDRVEKEWSHIDTLLRDISQPLSPERADTVRGWLSENGLSHLAPPLEAGGFDSLTFMGVLDMSDLEDLGIVATDDQFNIMAAVSLLAPPPSLAEVRSVPEWLEELGLIDLLPRFSDYSLERLASFWEVELAAVIGVEELGYRKRLRYGISELKTVHPDWSADLTRELDKAHDTRAVERKSPKVSSVSWPHPNSTLIEGSVQYRTKYLGSVIVSQYRGRQSAEEACAQLRAPVRTPEVILAISWKGVKFIENSTKEVVSTHAIRDIRCCSPDPREKTVFAYVSRDRGKHYAHVFTASSQEKAKEIRMTISQAFEICYQKVMAVHNKHNH